MKTKLIVVAGPTAVGKTALGIELAKRFNGEIISGDSQQVYRQLNIGTAKATPEEQAAAVHHLIDVRDVDEPYSAYDFVTEAEAPNQVVTIFYAVHSYMDIHTYCRKDVALYPN